MVKPYRLVKMSSMEQVGVADTITELIQVWEEWQDDQCTQEAYRVEDGNYEPIVTIQPNCG